MRQRQFGGKRDSRRHSTTSFSENVVVAEASCQMIFVIVGVGGGVGLTS